MQDSWTVKRLTLNMGLRVDNFNSMIDPTSVPAGRFVPARYFPERRNVPNWIGDLAPRLSAAYDLFGNGRTAIKAAVSKYYMPLTGNFADTYAPGLQQENRNWFDCAINAAGSACSGVRLPTDNDGLAQDHEIGPSGNPPVRVGSRPGLRSRHPAPGQHRGDGVGLPPAVLESCRSRPPTTIAPTRI